MELPGFLARILGGAKAGAPGEAGAQQARGLPLERLMGLAGYCAAHAVWTVSQGEVLIPIGGTEDRAGNQEILRLAAPTRQLQTALGRRWIESSPTGAARAVLVYDGALNLVGSDGPALIVMAKEHDPASETVVCAIGYGPAQRPGGFWIRRPKFILRPGLDAARGLELAEGFTRGALQHPMGADAWSSFLKE